MRTPTFDLHIEGKFDFNHSHFHKQKEQYMLLLKMSMGHITTCPRSFMLSTKTSGSGRKKKKLVSSLLLEGYQCHNISTVNNSLTFKRHFVNKLSQLVRINLLFKKS